MKWLIILGFMGLRPLSFCQRSTSVLLIGTIGANFTKVLTEICTFLLEKEYLNVSCAKWRPLFSASIRELQYFRSKLLDTPLLSQE